METKTRLQSLQAEVDGVEVGQTILYPRRVPNSERIMARAMTLKILKTMPHLFLISGSLHNNTALDEYYPCPTERPASAYYTYDPQLDLVVLEWGLIQNNEAKLHTYLNRVVNYTRRTLDDGMTLTSGHIAQIRESGLSFSLLDSLNSSTIAPTHPSFRTAQILQQNRFLVIASNGQLCDSC